MVCVSKEYRKKNMLQKYISSPWNLLLILDVKDEKEREATDGVKYLSKLLNTENIPENPPYLIFTAPYKICSGGCTGTDRGPNLKFVFPMFLGSHGRSLYKHIYPNDKKNINDLFKTKRTRAPITTCPLWSVSSRVTDNLQTKSTGYPGLSFSFEVKTKSTGFPDYETSTNTPRDDLLYPDETETQSTHYQEYGEITPKDNPINLEKIPTRSTYYDGYSESTTPIDDPLNFEKRSTRSTFYLGYNETTSPRNESTRSTYYYGYNETTKDTPSTGVPDLSVNRLSFQSADYDEFRYTRELDILRYKPSRINSIPGSYNQVEENGSEYSLQPEQEYKYRNSITPNSKKSHSKKMHWLKFSMDRKTINMTTSAPILMRKFVPLKREPKNYQESITTNLETSKPDNRSQFATMPFLPLH